MKPFLLGKKAIDSALHRMAHSTAPTMGRSTNSTSPVGPNVEAVKQGDKIVRLVVTCSCGERIEVECLYPAGK